MQQSSGVPTNTMPTFE